MAVTLAFQTSPQKRRIGRSNYQDNGLALADLSKLGTGRRSECGEKQTVHIRGFPVPAMAGNSHLLILKDFKQHKREMQLATAFSETTKLAKRVRELEDVDAGLEEYRQVLRTAISFQRRRRARCRLASISEEDCFSDSTARSRRIPGADLTRQTTLQKDLAGVQHAIEFQPTAAFEQDTSSAASGPFSW